MATEIAEWVPQKAQNLVVGPPRWTGQAVIADFSVASEQRVIEIGIVERLILERVDGKSSVREIHRALVRDGVVLEFSRILSVLNKFAFFGAIRRPFVTAHGIQGADAMASRPPQVRDDQIAAGTTTRELLGLWARLTWLANPAAFTALTVAGLAGSVALVFSVPTALAVLRSSGWTLILTGVVVSFMWTTVVTLLHENSHAAIFHALTGRTPFMALTKFGLLIMPNTHMFGLSLMTPARKAVVIVVGPLVSMILAALPVAAMHMASVESVQAVAAVCVLLDIVVISLGVSLFPNTDATRLLETAAGVDQIQAVSFRTLARKQNLPHGLPCKTRVAVRTYPFLLLATLCVWLTVMVWVLRRMLN